MHSVAARFPANLDRLHHGEEFLRSKSVEAIEASTSLSTHARMIECAMDLFNYFSVTHPHHDEDQLTVRLLGIRLFNGAGSATKLLLGGYYQASALQLRDLLETAFLLDLFTHDKSLIAAWHLNSSASQFKPVNVRQTLDKHDGFTERKREKAYKLLCELAGHPTQVGFQMLVPRGNDSAHCGPFFDRSVLDAVFSELAKLLVQAAAAFTRFFDISSKADCEMKIAFLETSGRWYEAFFNRPYDPRPTESMRELLAQLPR